MSEKRINRIYVYLSDSEKDMLEKQASNMGLKLSVYLRMLLFKEKE